MIKADRIKIVDSPPECTQIVRFYDLAVTKSSRNDWTAGVKLGMTPKNEPVILDLLHIQEEIPDVHEAIYLKALADGPEVPIRLEADRAGIVELQYILRDPRFNRYALDSEPPVGDKVVRAGAFAARVNAGIVYMVRAPWNHELLEEFRMFPVGAHDDIVDAASGAYRMIDQEGMLDWDVV
ncbi:MAG: phage terminase large subunit [Candidatus Competibacteraceae bacterium]|nr:phage terminase large subunit [Candidatus Competibacteraceae bacterium]